ncbi:MAG: hypothetical protein HY718_21650 [Planctomycetes bacterium]|nr:hypothetical protein [Planctomycetota bacterium]
MGGQGLWNLRQLLDADLAIVALCDGDERRRAATSGDERRTSEGRARAHTIQRR